ncbi:IPT/TIG domain-containing protein [Neorhizobium sp. BT27B]|uniref:IPT/TIG domain-containing protein n=1 Tax=Neorhizobium sp. BT27B TaxID=3142625 RepID=UPI003D29C9CC
MQADRWQVLLGAILHQFTNVFIPFVVVILALLSSTQPAQALSTACIAVNNDWGVLQTFGPVSGGDAPMEREYDQGFAANERLSFFAKTTNSTPEEKTTGSPENNGSAQLGFYDYLVLDMAYRPGGGEELLINSTLQPDTSSTLGITASGSTNVGSMGTIEVRVNCYGDTPTVTALSPASGSVLGGNSITLTGTDFTGVSVVSFGGTNTTFTVLDDSHISATVPAGAAAGPVNVRVTSAGGTSAVAAANQYTYLPLPVVTSISPNTGPTAGGNPVVIDGTDLTGATVTFDGSPATILAASATQITVTAPLRATAGTVDIIVTTPTGSSGPVAAAKYTYVGQPAITSLAPDRGPVTAGNTVIITGSNFIGVTAVSFGASSVSFVENSPTQITATAPAGVAESTVGVTVTGTGGTSSGGGNQYTFAGTPSVSGILPASGPLGGSSGILISGSNLAFATVFFDGVPVSVTANTASQVTVTAPAHAAGDVAVLVSTAGGSTVAGSFTYRTLPLVSTVSPNSGPLAGGNSVTITGSGLENPVSVTFGGIAGAVTASSDTSITVNVPSQTSAVVVDVVVTTSGGISTTGTGAYTYLAVPVVGSISPTSGPLAGGTTVTITGTGFTADSTVVFGSVAGNNIVFGNSTTLTAQSPGGAAGPVGVSVTTPGGTSGAASQFTYLAAPVATNSVATVAANSSASPITLNVTGTGITGVAVTTAATHGNAIASGTTISYTPTAGYSGTDSFSYTATNAGGTSAPATVTITVTPPVLSLLPAAGVLPAGQTGITYSQTFTAAGGTPNYTYTVPPGTLPAGLSLSPSGVLGGVPTTIGTSSFSVTAMDVYGATGTAIYNLTITEQPPIANSFTAVVPINSSGNTITPNLAGGSAASLDVSSQPANGSTSVNGLTLSYTPNPGFSGNDSFDYTATNGGGTSAPATVTVTVVNPTLTLAPATGALPAAIVGTAYSQTITTSGGTGTYAYTVTAGALPAGLSLSASGVIAGTPTAVASASFTITSTDTAPAFGLASYTLTVGPALPVASDVSFSIAANAAATPVPLALSGGPATAVMVSAPPSHGAATASGTGISYAPTAGYSGADSFTYIARNASGDSAPATVTVTVAAPTLTFSPVAGALPDGMVGAAYNETIVASAGTSPYSYGLGGGALPVGISLDPSTGALTGAPTTAGSSSFTITATDAYGATGSSAYTINVAVQPPIANPVSATVVRDAVNTPIALSITGGPANSVNVTTPPSNGTTSISGTTITYTPTAGYVGADSLAYTASNGSGTSTPATVSITITNPTLVLAPAAGPLPDGTVDTSYSQMLSASGGTAPYSFAVSGGSLPAGLALAPGSDLISGVPTATGTYTISITATDAGGATGVVGYTLRILPAALVLSPPTGSGLPPATIGTAYSYTGISASGGSGPASFAATGLPPGLAMAASGAINGTPTAAGNYSLNVTATDTGGAIATATYELTVNAGSGAFVFSPPGGALPQAMVGEAYSQDISATGGVAPLIYSLASGSLPPGLVLNVSNGDLNGPLTADAAPGTYSFSIAVRDAAGVTGSASFTLQVSARAVTVANKEVIVPPGGTPPNVYLNAGATGGPFVDATLGSVSPPAAGTAEIIRGELAQAGPVAPSGFYLRFTPNPGFSGRVVVGYQLISALGASNVGTVAYSLNFNPAAVAEDIDELVHDFVRTRQNLLSSTIRVPGLLERRRMENARDPVTIRMSPQETGMRAAFSTSLAQMEAARDRADGLDAAGPRPFNIWIDGAIRIHGGGDNEDDEDDRWGSFALLSVGMDYLLSDRALIGISAHFDRMTDPADEDAELTGNGWFAGPYVSLEIAKGVFFDTSLLYGGSWNDIDTAFFDGKFDTTRWMWDGSLKGEWYLDEVTVVTPKLRAVYLTETVKDYAVSNDAGDKLLLEGFSMEQLRASIGAEIERRIMLSNGMVLTPRLGATVGLAGLDGEGTFATVTAAASLQTETAWMFDVALLFDIEGEGDVSVGARARMSTRF